MVNDQMRSKFNTGEYSVHNREGGFDFPNKSVVGTHTLCITNQGRIIGHDTGGIFGTEQVQAYDSTIKVTFADGKILLENDNKYIGLTFNFSMTVDEFIKLYSKIPKNKLIFNTSTFGYVKWGSQAYSLVVIECNEKAIQLKNNKTIPLHRIEKLESDANGNVRLKGHFNGDEQISVQLFIPHNEKIKQINEQWEKTKKIYDLVGSNITICPVWIKRMLRGSIQNSALTMVYENNKKEVFILNENILEIVLSFSVDKDDWYLQSKPLSALVIQNNTPYLLEFTSSYSKTMFNRHFKSTSNQLYTGPYAIRGRIQGKEFQGESVHFLVDNKSVQLIFSDKMLLLDKIPCKQLSMIERDNKIFFLHQKEISLVFAASSDPLRQGLKGSIQLADHVLVGNTEDNNPFYIQQDERRFVFKQSRSKEIYSFDHQNVNDITVSGIDDELDLCTVEITHQNKVQAFHLPTKIVQPLIFQTYYHSKSNLVKQLPVEQMYVSWTRQVNDQLVYYYFGQLFLLQKGIQEIRDTVKEKNDRNVALLNYMYYAIQEQKRRLDAVAIYFPAALEQDHRDIIGKQDEEPFRLLQRNLMGTTSQLRSTLNEMESTLSAVSNFIIPKVDMEEFIKQREKRGYVTAVAFSAAAILFGTVFGTGIPILGGTFMGVGNYFSSRNAEKLEKINLENQYHRLEFYMTKALGNFDHLINTLMPYYVTEVNRGMFHSFQLLVPAYRKELDKESVKEQLFQRISEYYTFKQLPIDTFDIMKRENLIEMVHSSTNRASEFVNLFNQEVKYVPESVTIPRIG